MRRFLPTVGSSSRQTVDHRVGAVSARGRQLQKHSLMESTIVSESATQDWRKRPSSPFLSCGSGARRPVGQVSARAPSDDVDHVLSLRRRVLRANPTRRRRARTVHAESPAGTCDPPRALSAPLARVVPYVTSMVVKGNLLSLMDTIVPPVHF